MLHAEDDAQQHDVCELQPVAVFVLAEHMDEVIGKPAPEHDVPVLTFIRSCYRTTSPPCEYVAQYGITHVRVERGRAQEQRRAVQT
jgi:hypothetical protein